MKRSAAALILILFLCGGAYLNSLPNGFVYDDFDVVAGPAPLADAGGRILWSPSAYFTASGELSYRPLVTLSYLLDLSLWGQRPFGFHLTNLLLHLLNGILLWRLLARMGLEERGSLLAALLFLLHPAASASVNAVAYRDELLCALFTLLAFSSYLSRGKARFLSPLFYLAACLAKEAALPLPLVLFLYDRLRGRSGKTPLCVGLLAAALLYALLRFRIFLNPAEGRDAYVFSELGAWGRFTLWLLSHYARLILLPVGLRSEYVLRPPSVELVGASLLFLTALCLLLSGAVRGSRRRIFLLLWCLLSLLPVLNLFPLVNPVAVRYLYLPLLGASALAADFLGRRFRRPAAPLVLVVLCLFFSLTAKRNTVWKDGASFYRDGLRGAPRSYRFHNNLGVAYEEAGNLRPAAAEYRAALALKPTFFQARINLGTVLRRMGKVEEAIAEYETVLEDQPGSAQAHNNLGVALEESGRKQDALAHYRRAVALQPLNLRYSGNLCTVLTGLGEIREAETERRRVVALFPDRADLRFALACQMLRGRAVLDGSAEELDRVVSLDPSHAPAHYLLGLYYRDRDTVRAIGHFRRFLSLCPDHPAAWRARLLVEALEDRLKRVPPARAAPARRRPGE